MTIQADMELFVQVITSDLMSKKQIHFYRATFHMKMDFLDMLYDLHYIMYVYCIYVMYIYAYPYDE